MSERREGPFLLASREITSVVHGSKAVRCAPEGKIDQVSIENVGLDGRSRQVEGSASCSLLLKLKWCERNDSSVIRC